MILSDEFKTGIGKFLNGYTRALYEHKPEGWDHVDALVRLLVP